MWSTRRIGDVGWQRPCPARSLSLLRVPPSAPSVVVTATVVAEASGPFWGGLIVSLPIGAGPAYAMLALQHDAAFIAASALGSFAANAVDVRVPGRSGSAGAAAALGMGAVAAGCSHG